MVIKAEPVQGFTAWGLGSRVLGLGVRKRLYRGSARGSMALDGFYKGSIRNLLTYKCVVIVGTVDTLSGVT